MSWAPRHAARKWGLILKHDGFNGTGWERVEIAENAIDGSLKFEPSAMVKTDGAGEVALTGGKEWKGWIICQWSLGYPQLFWVTDQLKSEVPDFFEKVRIIREPIDWPSKSK